MTKKAFIKKAEKKGIKVYKNNINSAKPLEKVCGNITAKYPTSSRNLLSCR
ncbi:MAG: hypothetical protein KAJ14_15245 [Candidatus Omnitrophica bacterium]|nr:hypothetical protein [Candidatus Omnitrophota bacterium]